MIIINIIINIHDHHHHLSLELGASESGELEGSCSNKPSAFRRHQRPPQAVSAAPGVNDAHGLKNTSHPVLMPIEAGNRCKDVPMEWAISYNIAIFFHITYK